MAAESDDGTRRVLDLRFSPSIGFFRYPQYVDQGYYINGSPYDLVWRGLQYHLMLEGQYFLRDHPRISIGAGAALMIAPGPSAADRDDIVSVNKGRSAIGGYGGLSASGWARGGFRASALLGYGGFGDQGSFGGYGPFASLAAHYVATASGVAGGGGLRVIMAFLSSPAHGTVRAEDGFFMAAMLEATGDWLPRF